jgi:hypothetical protein
MGNIIKRPSLAYAKAFQREHELDIDYPYKITAPSLRITPIRYAEKSQADLAFEEIKEVGKHQAIYTFTNISGKKCKTKIIGYSSGKVKRKE